MKVRKISRFLVAAIFIVFSLAMLNLNINLANAVSTLLENEEIKVTETEAKTIRERVFQIFPQENVNSIEPLYSLDGQPDFTLVSFKKQGYAVFFSQSGEILEYDMQAASPFKDASGTLTYAGPAHYFSRKAAVIPIF